MSADHSSPALSRYAGPPQLIIIGAVVVGVGEGIRVGVTVGVGAGVGVGVGVGTAPSEAVKFVNPKSLLRYRRIHVVLDFRLSKRPIVNAHLVNYAIVIRPVNRVAADLQRITRYSHRCCR